MNWTRGQEINNTYTIQKRLGKGGFGLTYLAKHKRLTNRYVVIKTPNSDLQCDVNYDEYVRLFYKEANFLNEVSQKRHPHIVSVYDVFEEKQYLEDEDKEIILPCLVMEYIEGEDLYRYVQNRGKLTETEAVKYINQIGSALELCHQYGIIHRDVTPVNMMKRGQSDEVVLIDFGISGSTCTTTVDQKANKAFAPYEQMLELVKHPTLDVYTLSASFYYLVTGETPTPSIARKMVHHPLVSPKELNPQLSVKRENAILKGLELEPANRPQTVTEWLKLVNDGHGDGDGLPLQPFRYETVKVNEVGKIIKREQKTGQQLVLDLNGVPLELVYIKGGRFLMGSPDGEGYDDEKPQHWVTVGDFFLGKYPVTQEQYQAIMGENPSYFKGGKRPVEQVSWNKAKECCEKATNYLTEKYGKSIIITLPSESQWEYACRAGTTTPFSYGETLSTEIANYDGNYPYGKALKGEYRKETTEVGRFPANDWGIYDLHGNVWEWCEDHWHENYNGAPQDGSVWLSSDQANKRLNVLRGGSWVNIGDYCRSARRCRYVADDGNGNNGFRFSLSLP